MTNLVTELLSRPIGYHAVLAKSLRSVPAAVMLSQGLYWQRIAGEKGNDWWWVTGEEWYNQTGLTAESQATARKILCASGVWFEKLQGLPAKLYYRIDSEALSTFVQEYVETGLSSFRESRKQVSGKDEDRLPGTPETGYREPRNQDSGNPGNKETTLKETKEETKEETKSVPPADAAGRGTTSRKKGPSVKDGNKPGNFKGGAAAVSWTKAVATIFDETNERLHLKNGLEYLPFNWQVCSEENFKQLKNLRVKAIGPDLKAKLNRDPTEGEIIISFRAVFVFAWDYFYRIQKETSGALCFTPTNIYKSYNKIKSTHNGNRKGAAVTQSPLGRGINDNGGFDPKSGY